MNWSFITQSLHTLSKGKKKGTKIKVMNTKHVPRSSDRVTRVLYCFIVWIVSQSVHCYDATVSYGRESRIATIARVCLFDWRYVLCFTYTTAAAAAARRETNERMNERRGGGGLQRGKEGMRGSIVSPSALPSNSPCYIIIGVLWIIQNEFCTVSTYMAQDSLFCFYFINCGLYAAEWWRAMYCTVQYLVAL